MQRFSVKTRLGFRCLNEDTTAVRAVCSSVLGLESPSYIIAPVRGTPPPPFVAIRIHSWFKITTITSCDSSVKIRVNPWRKNTLNSHCNNQHGARAGKPELHNRSSPWHTAPTIRVHSCPFVVQNTTPFVAIRGSKHHFRGSNPPLTV
jgi:hypothetical protein